MPPIEFAIISGILCWRFIGDRTWRVCSLEFLTNEIVELRQKAGLEPYPISEDEERLGLTD